MDLHVCKFLKQFYPDSQAITPQMMFNFHLKCKDLQQKYGSLGEVPTDQANIVFNPTSLENAPEHGDTNPIYSLVFKETMQVILLGYVEDFDGQIAIVKIMEKVNQSQENEFDYRVFYAEDGRPAGLMYMTPFQIRHFFVTVIS